MAYKSSVYTWVVPLLKDIGQFFGVSSLVQNIADSVEGMSYQQAIEAVNRAYQAGVRRLANDEKALMDANNKLYSLQNLSMVPGLRDKVRSALSVAKAKVNSLSTELSARQELLQNEYSAAKDTLLNETESKRKIVDDFTKRVEETIPNKK